MSPTSPSGTELTQSDKRSLRFRRLARILATGEVLLGLIPLLPFLLDIATVLTGNGGTKEAVYIAGIATAYAVTIGYIGRAICQVRPSVFQIKWAKATWLLSFFIKGWACIPILQDPSLYLLGGFQLALTSWWVFAFAVSVFGLFADFTASSKSQLAA